MEKSNDFEILKNITIKPFGGADYMRNRRRGSVRLKTLVKTIHRRYRDRIAPENVTSLMKCSGATYYWRSGRESHAPKLSDLEVSPRFDKAGTK